MKITKCKITNVSEICSEYKSIEQAADPSWWLGRRGQEGFSKEVIIEAEMLINYGCGEMESELDGLYTKCHLVLFFQEYLGK